MRESSAERRTIQGMSDSLSRLPSDFVQTVLGLCGEDGRHWLRTLPDRLNDLAERWSLTILPPFDLSFHYVAPALRSDGTPVVVKLGRPDDEFAREMAALRRYDGNGMVRVLDAWPERNALLLERIVPGTMLTDLVLAGRDDEATAFLADTMVRIRRSAPTGEDAAPFPTAAEWGIGIHRLRERFDGGTGPFPVALVEEAEAHWRDLIASTGEPAFVHGDLHHFNLLRTADGEYIAIDPKGLIADPCYEVGPLFHNPNPYYANHPDARKMAARRIAILSERTGFSRERVRAWAIAQTVLSAWWYIEDSDADFDLDRLREPLLCAEHVAATDL
ncbi:MAG: aminoglycoside phosphotransferase family protein [Capsulimonadales bacterium]|nr:aminoglycoside phosphotransferase family protein [Capsulimonadales bacterium]